MCFVYFAKGAHHKLDLLTCHLCYKEPTKPITVPCNMSEIISLV